MTLTAKEYESLFTTSGGGADDVSSIISKVENIFDDERSGGMKYYLEHPDFGPLIFAIKQLQDEIDYLRTEIASNKGKATFPGLGTTSSTAMAGDTTTISKAQADAIAANTAKTSMTIGTGATQAMAGNTTIPPISITGLPANHTFDVQVRVVPPARGAKKGTVVLTWAIEDVPNRIVYSSNQTLI